MLLSRLPRPNPISHIENLVRNDNFEAFRESVEKSSFIPFGPQATSEIKPPNLFSPLTLQREYEYSKIGTLVYEKAHQGDMRYIDYLLSKDIVLGGINHDLQSWYQITVDPLWRRTDYLRPLDSFRELTLEHLLTATKEIRVVNRNHSMVVPSSIDFFMYTLKSSSHHENDPQLCHNFFRLLVAHEAHTQNLSVEQTVDILVSQAQERQQSITSEPLYERGYWEDSSYVSLLINRLLKVKEQPWPGVPESVAQECARLLQEPSLNEKNKDSQSHKKKLETDNNPSELPVIHLPKAQVVELLIKAIEADNVLVLSKILELGIPAEEHIAKHGAVAGFNLLDWAIKSNSPACFDMILNNSKINWSEKFSTQYYDSLLKNIISGSSEHKNLYFLDKTMDYLHAHSKMLEQDFIPEFLESTMRKEPSAFYLKIFELLINKKKEGKLILKSRSERFLPETDLLLETMWTAEGIENGVVRAKPVPTMKYHFAFIDLVLGGKVSNIYDQVIKELKQIEKMSREELRDAGLRTYAAIPSKEKISALINHCQQRTEKNMLEEEINTVKRKPQALSKAKKYKL